MSSSEVSIKFNSSTYITIIANMVFDFLMKMNGLIDLFTYHSFSRYFLRWLCHVRPNYFNPYKDCCILVEYMLRGFVMFASSNLNNSEAFIYISLSTYPCKCVMTTSMRHISSSSETVKLIKNWNVIVFMTGEYVSL